MCGIAGLYRANSSVHPRVVVEKMIGALRHRGPDFQDIKVLGDIALGHARLSIIDLSAAGNQPMTSTSGRYTMVYNGEIYNFLELRDQLTSAGYVFRGSGDSEVVLASFEEWGVHAFSKWNGMFAIAIWDSVDETLWLARDRFGIKPLFVAHLGAGSFGFSSELHAFRAITGFSPPVNGSAVLEYLSYGAPLGENTIFKGIRDFPPGNFMKIAGGTSVTHEYVPRSSFDNPNSRSRDPGLEVASSELRAHLRRSVSSQLVSDVPVGIFLSGGLDSSTIAVLAAEKLGKNLATFSIGFGDSHDDGELPTARRTAQMIGSNHQEILLGTGDVPTILAEVIRSHGQPFGDPAALPIYQMSRAIRSKVKVVLQGDGGDEVFGGYDRYARLNNRKLYQAIGLLSPLASLLERYAPPLFRAMRTSAAFRMESPGALYARLMSQDDYFGRTNAVLSSSFSSLFSPEIVEEHYRSVSDMIDEPDLARRALMIDRRIIMPDVYLPKVDRASMAQSIEVRVPLLDNELVEFMGSLDRKYLIQKQKKKFLLRHAMRNLLPHEVLNGKKAGFGVPQGQWLRTGLSEYFGDMMLATRSLCGDLFDYEMIAVLFEEHRTGKADHGYLLYKLLCFFIWAEGYGNFDIGEEQSECA